MGWDDNWVNSNYYGQIGITGVQYPGPCSSLFPLLSMQVCSTVLTYAAGNTTNAHKPSHPCSLTMASETSDSTPSLTATVMPGWQQAERARGSGGRGPGAQEAEQSYPVLGISTRNPENSKDQKQGPLPLPTTFSAGGQN